MPPPFGGVTTCCMLGGLANLISRWARGHGDTAYSPTRCAAFIHPVWDLRHDALHRSGMPGRSAFRCRRNSPWKNKLCFLGAERPNEEVLDGLGEYPSILRPICQTQPPLRRSLFVFFIKLCLSYSTSTTDTSDTTVATRFCALHIGRCGACP